MCFSISYLLVQNHPINHFIKLQRCMIFSLDNFCIIELEQSVLFCLPYALSEGKLQLK